MVALAACQSATIGPRAPDGVLEGWMPLEGAACIDAWVKPGTALATELRAVQPPVICDKHFEDERRQTGAAFYAGLAWERHGLDWNEIVGDGLQVRIKLFDSPKPFLTAEWLDDPRGGAAVEGGERLPIRRSLEIEGDEIRVEALVTRRDGTPDRLVCVGAVDVTTRASWAWICRPSARDAAVATAEGIIADDVPAIRFWRTGAWNAPL